MKRPIIDWKVVFNWRTYAVVKYIRRPLPFCISFILNCHINALPSAYYIALIVICVLVILMSVFHKEIVNWLKPAADWMHE